MADLQTQFKAFNSNIYLTGQSDDFKRAKEKDDSILKELKVVFKEKGYPIIESFKQGSFAVDTAIYNLDGDYDFDRTLIIDADYAPDDPVEPKRVIKEVLEKRNFKDPKIKKPCVTADYKSFNLHIDYTVYKVDQSYTTFLAIGKHGSRDEHKDWAQSDQKGLIEWINNVECYTGNGSKKRHQYKRLIRFMKRWRDVNFSDEVKKKIFSIGLTVMIKSQYTNQLSHQEQVDDLKALSLIVEGILNGSYLKYQSDGKYRVSVQLPTLPYRDIFQHKTDGYSSEGSDKNIGTQFRNKLIYLNDELKKAIVEPDPYEASKLLRAVFGNCFPLANIKKNENTPYSRTGTSA
ncbi:nucleotidyltransferase [uncultured Psychrobacter sp.]|uniref:nucleotidyltransferase domain-containing protein n=1 Tax=uncultured Psychrobacter sp. TaxID=259303 RepID=UPI002621151C|nr:nucleotidyltransferase [uncultured Psychrobacter sp.]